ncbi:ribonuclease H-like domain-containing protein [Candidatus Wolfebacteria bacterium]|nr:ribonuclease H-like domain-containing protein [Candidatus Wolfebacteria bacterium]
MREVLVLDIETSNTFSEVGRDNFGALNVSLIGLYSYDRDKYFAFDENEIDKAADFLKNASKIIGFSISRFDLPVLEKHLDFDIFKTPRFDILDEIEYLTGKRISLDLLAKANLGVGKNGKSLEAVNLYREGKMEELKNYCLNDVKITKDLYDLILKQRHLMVPQWEKEPAKINFDAPILFDY